MLIVILSPSWALPQLLKLPIKRCLPRCLHGRTLSPSIRCLSFTAHYGSRSIWVRGRSSYILFCHLLPCHPLCSSLLPSSSLNEVRAAGSSGQDDSGGSSSILGSEAPLLSLTRLSPRLLLPPSSLREPSPSLSQAVTNGSTLSLQALPDRAERRDTSWIGGPTDREAQKKKATLLYTSIRLVFIFRVENL